MRVVTLLLYVLSLLPFADACASGDCNLVEQEIHHVMALTSHDCCAHQEEGCELGGHHHSHGECQRSTQVVIRSESEELRRAPASLAATAFYNLFSQGPLRAPPVVIYQNSDTALPIHLRSVITSVIRC